jgi:hypothetical protein
MFLEQRRLGSPAKTGKSVVGLRVALNEVYKVGQQGWLLSMQNSSLDGTV